MISSYAKFEWAAKHALHSQTQRINIYNNSKLFPKLITPFTSKNLRECLRNIPWQLRRGKQIQKWILKHRFPELFKIPNYNSLVPPNSHFMVHASATIIHYHLIVKHFKHHMTRNFYDTITLMRHSHTPT